MATPRTAVVLHSFQAQEEDEIDLVAGQTVELLRSINDSWWMVRAGRGRGRSRTRRTQAPIRPR